MKLHKDVYELFYLDLLNKFRDEDLDETDWDPDNGLDSLSPQLWSIYRLIGNQRVFVVCTKILSKYGIKDPTIFNRYRSNFNSDIKKEEGKVIDGIQEIRDAVLLAGLDRLGFVSDNLSIKISKVKTTKKLFADYMLDKHSLVLKNFPELLKGFEDEPQTNNTTNNNTELEVSDVDKIEIKLKHQLFELLQVYFDCINEKEYLKAFQYWHPKQQSKTFKNGFDDFYNQHYYIKEIGFVSKDGWVEVKGDKVCLNFCHWQGMDSYISEDVKKICRFGMDDKPNGNFTPFLKSLNRLIDKAERQGFYLANEPIQSFLDFTVFEKIYSIGAHNRDRIKNFLPILESVSIRKFVEIQFSCNDGKFLIDKIDCKLRGDLSMNPYEKGEFFRRKVSESLKVFFTSTKTFDD